MAATALCLHQGAQLVGRQDLPALATPPETSTWKPIPHADVVRTLVEALGYRGLTVLRDEYAVTPNGMRLFGVLTLDVSFSGVHVTVGVRNSHDKSFSLALVAGYRVFVCDNLAFVGDFKALVRKHSKNLDPTDAIDSAVGRIQRGFEPMRQAIDAWRDHTLPDASAKLLIYDAFVAGNLAVPKHLGRKVHDLYFEPQHPEFEPRTLWSLSNAFTGAFKELDPIPRVTAATALARFLEGRHP